MKTQLGACVVETKGYDIMAEFENQEDRFGIKAYLTKKLEEATQQASQYLEETPKQVYYCMSGYPTDVPWAEEPDEDFYRLISYTDEEVERIKQLLVEAWNMYAEPEAQIKSYDELDPNENLEEYRGCNSELDQLLWQRAEEQDFALRGIDLSQQLHAYLFSGYRYNTEKQAMESYRYYQRVVLTDEEYLYLLTQQLFYQDFSFNHLLLINAPLAQKICANTVQADPVIIYTDPYIILMDEVVSDMQAIISTDK